MKTRRLLKILGIIGMLGMWGPVSAQPQIALLKYGGGGDWYANPTSLTNLIAFCNQDQQMAYK